MLPVDESFAKSCGQIRPLMLKVCSTEGEKTAKFVINKPFAFVGSNLNCDICLPMPAVSKRHVYLQLIGGRLYCVDQASREGIFWEQRQRLFGWLDAGKTLRVGPYQITLLEPPGAEDFASRGVSNQAPILMDAKSVEPPSATLYINDSLSFPLQRQLTIIGRSKYCHLELDHEDLSRVHASLLRTRDGRYWIIDLMSRTGVKLNGIRCLVSHLNHGDIIKIGNYSVEFRLRDAPFAAASSVLDAEKRPSFLSESVNSVDPITEPTAPVNTTHIPKTQTETSKIESLQPTPDAPTPKMPAEMTPLIPEILPQEGKLVLGKPGPIARLNNSSLVKKGNRQPVPTPPSSPELQLVSTLMVQMQQMQQEMYNQMRFNMELMTGFIEKLHQSQREMIKEDMEQFSRLNQEIAELREKLKRSDRERPRSSTGQADQRTRTTPQRIKANPPRALPVDRSAKGSSTEQRVLSESTASNAHPPLEVDKPQDNSATYANPSHLWITERIATLETERLSRWQRMMAKVLGR